MPDICQFPPPGEQPVKNRLAKVMPSVNDLKVTVPGDGKVGTKSPGVRVGFQENA
jgi:hypothetical protein